MKKIIVRIPQWLGDAVVSTIFLSRLKMKNQDAQISVLCLPFLAPIFEQHPAVAEVVRLPKKNSGTIWSVARELKSKSFDEAYILPKSFRTALEAWLADIPRRIGFKGDMQRFLLTEPHQRFDHKGFDPYRYLNLLGEKNLGEEDIYPFFPQQAPSTEEMDLFLGRSIKSIPRPILGLAPKSVAPARTWDPNKFGHVAQRFVEEIGGTVFLFGIEAERPTTAMVKSRLKPDNVIDFTGRLNLPDQAGLMGWAIGLCDQFLCNDSGLMHIAIALGVPTLAIYGSGDPGYAGYKKKKAFAALQHKDIFCVPCLKNHCVRSGSGYNECLNAVTVDEVLSSLKRLGVKV